MRRKREWKYRVQNESTECIFESTEYIMKWKFEKKKIFVSTVILILYCMQWNVLEGRTYSRDNRTSLHIFFVRSLACVASHSILSYYWRMSEDPWRGRVGTTTSSCSDTFLLQVELPVPAQYQSTTNMALTSKTLCCCVTPLHTTKRKDTSLRQSTETVRIPFLIPVCVNLK